MILVNVPKILSVLGAAGVKRPGVDRFVAFVLAGGDRARLEGREKGAIMNP
jgi:hypothetical protein